MFFQRKPGCIAKSSPLDFATKTKFPLFSVGEKHLIQMIKSKIIIFHAIPYLTKNEFWPSWHGVAEKDISKKGSSQNF